MKQNSLQKWISNDNVGRAVAVLNKPWFHSEDEQVCAAQTILLMVSDVPLAQEVLELLRNENSIQKYVIDTLISKVLHCPTKYYSNKELQSIGLQNLALLVEQCATEPVYDPLKKLSTDHNNNGTIVELKVKDYKYQKGFHYYQVDYNGSPCLVKIMPYEADRYERGRGKKTIICRDLSSDDNGLPFLVEDKGSLIEELYEEDTVRTFTYCCSNTTDEELEYHVVRDEYGLTHRYYGRLHVQQKNQSGKIDFYIKGIDPKSKTLILAIYDPTIERKVNEWYDADRIFGEIEEADSKEDLFGNVLSKKDNLGTVDVTAGDEPNSKAHHVNLDVVFYSNNTLSLEERRNSNIEIDDCYRIQLPESDDNCSLVLFMKDNSFKGIPLSEITCMREGERISTDVNFYKIKNWFVAPKDTIVGARIVISGCAYAAFLTIDNNYESTLADSSLTGVESCQPFIIPKECLGKDVNKLLGRKVQVDEIQDKTVRELQSYGIFIN
ncbi:hypothetical protein [Hoylesella nanceiensis]|uniref:hypothetical protein n=1 Tax=Hoylesella nanceiensis TaxID=425941 RepID=UPI00242A581F|nr:hypothetical protein [Hoylesella nanceiensis]